MNRFTTIDPPIRKGEIFEIIVEHNKGVITTETIRRNDGQTHVIDFTPASPEPRPKHNKLVKRLRKGKRLFRP